jgi:hypothetical protein
MRQMMITPRILIGLAFLQAALLAVPASADAQQTAAELRKLAEGRLVLAGSVLDQDGRPLTGVEVEVVRTYFAPAEPSLQRSESQRIVVDGAFRFECQPCLALRLKLYKTGYHSDLREVTALSSPLRPPVVEELRHQVRLQKAAPAARLQIFQGQIVTRVGGGDEQVVGVSKEAAGPRQRAQVHDLQLKSVRPLPFVRLQAAEEGNQAKAGVIAGKSMAVPVGTRLDFGDAGGVQRYEPQAKRVDKVLLEMKEAPEGGYQPTLDLDPVAASPTYFFCKIGDLYGRGTVSVPTLEETSQGRRVVAYVEITVNPDGSRNLEELR